MGAMTYMGFTRGQHFWWNDYVWLCGLEGLTTKYLNWVSLLLASNLGAVKLLLPCMVPLETWCIPAASVKHNFIGGSCSCLTKYWAIKYHTGENSTLKTVKERWVWTWWNLNAYGGLHSNALKTVAP